MLSNKNLIDEAIKIDKRIKTDKKRLDEIKATLQADGLTELENKNIKYLQMFSNEGSCDMAYKQKLEIDNVPLLEEIFGDVIDDKITKKAEIKYEVDSKFKNALIALYIGDYKKHDINSLLDNLGLNDNFKKVALKKLKGSYLEDKKLLESLGVKDNDLEEELDVIREDKNYNIISKYIDINSVDTVMLEKLKRAISVEESLSIGLSYGE